MCVRVVAVRGVRASGSGLVAWAGGVCRWQQRPVRGRGIRCKLSRVSLGLQLSVTRQGGPTVLRSGGGVPHGESAARAGYMERQRPAGLHGVSAARRASWGISSPGRQHAASSPQLGRSGWARARRLSRAATACSCRAAVRCGLRRGVLRAVMPAVGSRRVHFASTRDAPGSGGNANDHRTPATRARHEGWAAGVGWLRLGHGHAVVSVACDVSCRTLPASAAAFASSSWDLVTPR